MISLAAEEAAVPTLPRRGRKALRVLTAIGVAIGVLAALAGIVSYAFVARFQPDPVIAEMPKAKDRAEAVRQDLTVLGRLLDYDRSFSADARTRFEVERMRLIEDADTLTPQALEMQVSRLVALAGNGHTTVGRMLRRINRVPIRLAWFAEGLFVVRADPEHARLVGTRVASINGKTPEEMLAALTPYVSGPAEHAKSTSPFFLESPYALAGVWPAMSTERATYVLQPQAGAAITVTLAGAGYQAKAPYVDPSRDLAPQPLENEGAPWANLLGTMRELPLVLRDPDASVYVKKLDDDAGLYIHISNVMGDERGELSTQLAAILDAIKPASLRYAILDMRFDGGGDYTKTLGFTRDLPKRIAPDGRLFILTDNTTFSAAIVTTARAKYFGGSRAVILGERVGDRERFWAEGGKAIELPNSRIHIYFATGYHDWNEGCGWKDLGRCFWVNIPFDVPAGSLSPKQSTPWRFADYRAGIDTVLEEALRQKPQKVVLGTE